MAPISIPKGFVFIPRQYGVNVALQLLDAAEEVGADRKLSVRTTTAGGYHVQKDVAERYQENLGLEAEEEEEELEGDESEGDDSKPEPLPVTAESTHAEIDEYAGKLDPKIEFPANTNRADKIALIEAARQPQSADPVGTKEEE